MSDPAMTPELAEPTPEPAPAPVSDVDTAAERPEPAQRTQTIAGDEVDVAIHPDQSPRLLEADEDGTGDDEAAS